MGKQIRFVMCVHSVCGRRKGCGRTTIAGEYKRPHDFEPIEVIHERGFFCFYLNAAVKWWGVHDNTTMGGPQLHEYNGRTVLYAWEITIIGIQHAENSPRARLITNKMRFTYWSFRDCLREVRIAPVLVHPQLTGVRYRLLSRHQS